MDEQESNDMELGVLWGHCWPMGPKSGWAATYLSKLSFPTSLSAVALTSIEAFVFCKAATQRVKSPEPGAEALARSPRWEGQLHKGLAEEPTRKPRRRGSSFALCLLVSPGLSPNYHFLPLP